MAKVARCISTPLRDLIGEAIDLELLQAAALLHDVAKARCLATARDHALEGAEWLRKQGFPAIAVLVERHVDLGAWDPKGPIGEAEILNYSDKRIRHEDLVTLSERFCDLIRRYGRGDAAVEQRIRANWLVTQAVERKIFRNLPFGPEDLRI